VQSIYEIRRIRLRELLAEVWGGNTSALTKAMGWETASFASRLISDSPGNQKNIGSRMARDIEKAANKPKFTLDTPPWADETAHSARERAETRESRPPMFSRSGFGGAKPVPVVGLAIANPTDDGYFDDQQFPVGAGEGYIRWPTKDPNAYAVQVRGDSMSPRIRHGEYVVVEPNTAITPGEDVVVRARNGRKMVKRLLYQRGNEVSLGSINERHPTLTISLEEIESIHFVGGIAPRTAKEEP
jgi:phage repressor protein C with HTH and peptisase S24 domain